MRITNTQKKELSEIFKSHKLNLFDFDILGEYQEFKIKYKYDYFSFFVNRKTYNDYHLTIYPIDNTQGISTSGNWDGVKSRFNTWVQQLAKEFNTATGWETFQSENFLDTGFDDLNTPFSESEKLQIRQSINELKERIRKLELSDRSHQIIEKKLDDLSTKIDEQHKKFDWKSLFIGTIANLIMTGIIPPDMQGTIWEYVKMAFRLKLLL